MALADLDGLHDPIDDLSSSRGEKDEKSSKGEKGPVAGPILGRAMRLPYVRPLIFILALCSACALGCEKKPEAQTETQTQRAVRPASAESAAPAARGRPYDPDQLAVFAALPTTIERPDNPLTDDKVALGKMLWFDARLSRGHDVSCNSCHDVTKTGADEAPVSTGTKKRKGTRNTPTIVNAAGEFAQGWDARWSLVEDAVIPHAAEATVMDMTGKRLLETLASVPAYKALFAKAFPEEHGAISESTASKAIGAYARKLLTPSRWDAFLSGDQSALTEDEKVGLGAFMDANCTTCHAGKYVGAAQSQKLGVAKPWPSTTGIDDVGRFEITKDAADKGVFKVPTLRNVTRTAPYLHDGSVASLDEVVKLMERHQVGRELTDDQAKSIVTFLGALAADAPKDLVTAPSLPPSGPKTPKPD